MRRISTWMMVVLLCCGCATGGKSGGEKPDARRVEGQAELDEATKLKDAGRYSEALVLADQVLTRREAVLGRSHPDVAHCLTLVGELHRRRGDLAHAEPLLQRALEIQKATLGGDHPSVARTLNILAKVRDDQGAYDQAESLLQRALAIQEAALGGHHLDVAQTLNTLALVYVDQGQYGRAEPLHQRALAIREAALGHAHPLVADSLNHLANIYWHQGQYGQAEPLHQRALAIREAALGRNHPDVADSLTNLANLYLYQGQYGRAESLYQRALATYEAALGGSHPRVAASLQNLALVYSNRGQYGRAEPLYQRALAIREEALGHNHPDVATSLSNLANIYWYQGQYGLVEPLFHRALAIREAALGHNHPSVAASLNNLAAFYQQQGLYDLAEPLHRRALAIREATLGGDHPDIADSLTNLAMLHQDQGQYGQAEPLYQRALAIREQALGRGHSDVGSSLNDLARLYLEQGLYGRAEPLFQRALAIQEASRGGDSPDVAQTLNGFARLRVAQHRLADALPLFTRAFAISEHRLRLEALDFSESRLSTFLHYLREDEQALYSLLRAHPGDARVRRLALGAVLLLKGRSVEETAHISRTLYRSLGAEEHETFERLRGLRTRFATLSLEGPGSLSAEDYRRRLETLADEGDALEADLAKRSAPLRALTALPPPAEIVERVAASLPQDGALVEFIAYEDTPLVPEPGRPRARLRRQLHYLALVLFPDASTRAVDLGPAEPIELAATRLRNALANRDASFQSLARELYLRAFHPLRPVLGSTRRLLLSPDGQLDLIPFAALQDGQGFLLDTFDFTYLTSGRQLLPRPQEVVPSSSVFVLADPDFTASPPSASSTTGPLLARAEPSGPLERFFSLPRGDLLSSAWVPLPGTRQEAESIQRLLPQAQLFLGREATKERLLQLPTPGILHLATHGFFLEDAPEPGGSRGVGTFGGLGDNPLAPRPEDPLLRSGLALAGARAQVPVASTPSESPSKAALVTALEMAGLDLWGTQLVVLSACDTGRGDVRLGQGVYGLRRSLVAAGAETVVMSLWKVKDDSTQLLMDLYYRNLVAGQGRASALREAMRSLRAIRPHPHDWAPFISLGSDAPLRAIPLTVP